MDTTKWREDLSEDLELLNIQWNKIVDIRGEKDSKLQHLINLIDDKIQKPLNDNNKKVIVFTAFADTANYLYDNVNKYLLENHGINTALITGSKNM